MERLESQILDAAPDAMVVTDQCGVIVLVNNKLESVFCYTRDDLLGRSVEVLLPERSRPDHPLSRDSFTRESCEQSVREGSDVFGRRNSGDEFPAEVSISSAQTEHGLFVVRTIRDITERIANEKLLLEVKNLKDTQLTFERSNQLAAVTDEVRRARASRDRLALIVENSMNEIYVADAITFKFVNANRSARTNLGYTEDEILRLMPWDFVEGLSMEKAEALIAPLRAGELEVQTIAGEHRRKDGTTYPVSTTLQLMASLSPPVLAAITRDITDLKQREEIINLRDRAIEALDVGVSITDASQENTPIVYVNQALCEQTGYSPDELLGQDVRILQKNNPAQPEHLKIQEAQAKGESVQVILKSTRKDGSEYMDEVVAFPVNDASGKLTHYIGINRDVTSSLQTQARLHQAQKIDAVSQLSGGIAHDFNNLLSVIIGNLELLSMEISNEAQLDYINEADSAAQMGARLTRRLLSFAKQSQLEPVVLNVNDRTLSVMDLLRSTIGETIILSANLAPDLWSVCADPSEIESALVNLCLNARDAMPTGGKLTITTENIFASEDYDDGNIEQGEYVKLSVSDNGCGMTDEVKARLFDPFFTTKESGKGTGLGLASTHGFVTQSGGYIHVYSEVGHGTVINLYLPRYQEVGLPAESKPPEPIVPTSSNARILVVEDNDMVRNVTVKRLQVVGFNIDEAANGAEAISFLKSNADIDLVLTDIVMEGGISGFEVAHWVQDNMPDCKILFTSGFNEQMAEVKGVETAQIKMLSKPCGIAELQEAVESIID